MKTERMIKIASRIFIATSALTFFYVSMLAFSNPQSVMDLVQVKLDNTDALSSIRGVYGGVGLVIAISLGYLLITDITKGLRLLCLLWGCYALSRLITIFAEGPLGAFGLQWMIIESIFFVIAGMLIFANKGASTMKSN